MTPAVSIVMPVRDPHPAYFREAVRSILNQTFTDFELLVLEAPPGRSAAAILREYSDARIVHVSDPGWGHVIDQRNHGLRMARSEYVALMDADDIAERNRLEVQYAFLRANPAVQILGSQIEIIGARGETRGYRSFPQQHEQIADALRSFNPISHPSVMLIRRDVIAGGGYQYRRYPAEDYELWCRLCKAGLRIRNSSHSLLRYRIHPDQVKAFALRGVIRGTIDVKRMHWRGKMRFKERCRLNLERLMLFCPQSLVSGALKRIEYSQRTAPDDGGRNEAAAIALGKPREMACR